MRLIATPSTIASDKRSIAIDICWLLPLLFLLYFFCLGAAPLGVPDGARYAEIGREMLRHHHYLLPHLNGILYLEKPPLFYWLQALALHWFGINEWAARFWIATLAVSLCLANYGVAYYYFNRRCARLACLFLATSILFFIMAHRISIDMCLSFCLTLALYSFIIGIQPKQKKRWLYASYSFAGLAILTKGLIGLVLPTLIIGLWVALNRQWKLIKRMCLPTGLLLVILIAAPWHVLVQWQVPQFFHFYFIEQQFLRYSTLIADRYQPVWYFIPPLLAGFFPWTCFLPQALYNAYRYQGPEPGRLFLRYLLIWSVSLFVFFSFSKSKLLPYILPLMPALALLTAHAVSHPQSSDNPTLTLTARRTACALLLILGGAMSVTVIGAGFVRTWPNLWLVRSHLLAMGLCLVGMTLFGTYQLTRNRLNDCLLILLTGSFCLLLTLTASSPYLDDRPIKPLATALKARLNPGDRVVCYEHYYQDLPFYLGRRVTVANWINEFQFGARQGDTDNWLINKAQFWRLWQTAKPVYALMDYDDYEVLRKRYPKRTLHLLKRSHSDVLVSNHY